MAFPLKAVLIGCGNIAGGYDERLKGDQILTHAKAFSLHPDVELAGATDPDAGRLRAFASHWKVPATDSSLEALLEKVRPDLVSICSPNASHAEVLAAALRVRPKAIVCEKPLALTSAESERMLAACRESETLLAVNYLRRWDESLLKIGQRIGKGEFGPMQSARVQFTKGVFHNASHAINLLQSWCGPVRAVRPLGQAVALLDGDLQASFGLAFERCPDAVFQCHDSGNFNFFEIDLTFAQGRILLPWNGSGIEIARAEASPIVPGEWKLGAVSERLPWTLGTAMARVIDNVVQAIRGKAPLVMPAEEALETVKICERIRSELRVRS